MTFEMLERRIETNHALRRSRLARQLFVALCVLTVWAGSSVAQAPSVAPPTGCLQQNVREVDGVRRLALLVAVGEYKSPDVKDLAGPPNDAQVMYDLLTGANGYGFPKENVCVLQNEQATTAAFKEMFNKALVERARPGDIAVLYYAGHGSQTPDRNADEPDEWDETLMLHDARTGGVRDLRDDELNTMLTRLGAKTQNVTVILDSCNSGTAMRGDAGTYVARFQVPEPNAAADADENPSGDGAESWTPEELPGLVILTAATDGTSALEFSGRGVFTSALVAALREAGDQPLTYAQVARMVPPRVKADSYQVPYFHGDLDKHVFGNTTRRRPVSWEVVATAPELKIAGPPMAGIGKGAELRLYAGSSSGADTNDPGKAKATIVVDQISGLNATAHVAAALASAAKPAVGDLAILVRAADEALRIRVRLRPSNEPGGIPAARAASLRTAVANDAEAAMLVDWTNGGAGDFELSVGSDGKLVLHGPENRIRTQYGSDDKVARNLWQHARQRALLRLRGEGGSDFRDDETLQVRAVPLARGKQTPCADGIWEQAAANSEQIIPLCHRWQIEVTLAASAPHALLIGGVVLSADGATFGLPADGRRLRLNPGERAVFDGTRETFQAGPPLDTQDDILVFGTQETNPVDWHLLTSPASTRSASAKGGLYRALDLYLRPGTRGQGTVDDDIESSTWTMSSMTARVEANSRFLAEGDSGPIAAREYTIKNFDIRPYLPDDEGSALHKVLLRADWLARTAAETDGFSYKQHAWNKPSDAENLRLGIDCSRSIWFAFTRSGLPYNPGDRYLTTAQMVGSASPMRNEFESCDGDPNIRIGDVLVYRDAQRGDGHVVMVIDPDKRIAWGSHGWDGNARELAVKPDTGVEYQLIKYKQDWRRWDRSSMRQSACWRYRRFADEARTPRGQPGLRAIAEACDKDRQCGRTTTRVAGG